MSTDRPLRATLVPFALRFGLIFLASQAILEFVNVVPVQRALASIVGMVLHVPVEGIYLPLSDTMHFEISAFCTGLTSVAMLGGLLFGFRLPPLREKIAYFLAGGALILLANVARLLFVVQVGYWTHDARAAEWAHTLTWFVMSAIVLGLWYAGMKQATKSKTGNELARKLAGI